MKTNLEGNKKVTKKNMYTSICCSLEGEKPDMTQAHQVIKCIHALSKWLSQKNISTCLINEFIPPINANKQ